MVYILQTSQPNCYIHLKQHINLMVYFFIFYCVFSIEKKIFFILLLMQRCYKLGVGCKKK